MSFSSKSFRHIPLWGQLAVGLVVVVLIFIANYYSPIYVSEWYTEDSNFFESGIDALERTGFEPSAPTLLIFWEKDCQVCKKVLKNLKNNQYGLRLIGVHNNTSTQEQLPIQQIWMSHAPQPSTLYIDETEILQSTFGVPAVPYLVLILPRKKKMYSLVGEISKARTDLKEILQR